MARTHTSAVASMVMLATTATATTTAAAVAKMSTSSDGDESRMEIFNLHMLNKTDGPFRLLK